MLAVSAAAEFLRCSEAAHLVCTCNAFNNDPDLRDRTAAGSREAERDQDTRDAAAAAAAAEAAAAAPVSPTDAQLALWSRVVGTASVGSGEFDDGDDDGDPVEGEFDFDEETGFAFGDVEGYGQY